VDPVLTCQSTWLADLKRRRSHSRDWINDELVTPRDTLVRRRQSHGRGDPGQPCGARTCL